MKIISKFYDCIDYLNDYQTDNIFVRNSSAYYIQSTYNHLNRYKDREYSYSEIVDINEIFLNQFEYYAKYKNVDHLEIYGKFVFIPNHKLDIPIKFNVFNINNILQLKIDLYNELDHLEINDKLNKFINETIIPNLTINTDNKVRNQPWWL